MSNNLKTESSPEHNRMPLLVTVTDSTRKQMTTLMPLEADTQTWYIVTSSYWFEQSHDQTQSHTKWHYVFYKDTAYLKICLKHIQISVDTVSGNGGGVLRWRIIKWIIKTRKELCTAQWKQCSITWVVWVTQYCANEFCTHSLKNGKNTASDC